MTPELTLGSLIEVYVDIATIYVGLDDIFGAVDALIARDARNRWWEETN